MYRTKRLSGKKGFTLIEVTLAIVIGVIMIAGATLLYNQSKISSGNSRAQAKTLALQQLVEEYAANNAGTYPTIEPVRALWKRKRPDDFLKSPWGGLVGTSMNQSADTGTRGVANNSFTVSAAMGDVVAVPGDSTSAGASPWGGNNDQGSRTSGTAQNTVNGTPTGGKPWIDQPKSGGVSYSLNNSGAGGAGAAADQQNNTETQPVWDAVTNVTKTVRGYSIWIYDTQGQFPNFVTGGKLQ